MKNRDNYSVLALCMIFLAEVFAVLSMRSDIKWLWCVSVVALVTVLYLWYDGNKNNLEFKIESVVASNLLANAIAPRTISAFYLLFFVLHIGWLTDSTFNLFLPKAYGAWNEVVASLFVGLTGTLFLIIFFPKSGGSKSGEVTNLVISGISTPFAPKGWDSKNDEEKEQAYLKSNLRPLVRILQLICDAKNENCKFLILRTNCINDANLQDVLRLVMKDHTASFECEDTDDKLKLLIEEVAKREFPKWHWLDTLHEKIEFTPQCDYDDFNECYSVLSNSINQIDEKKYYLHFNITPGTSNIGGLMTLMSMDPQRKLYYYRQKEGIDENERMKLIEKDYESLKVLFSSTLEKIQRMEQ